MVLVGLAGELGSTGGVDEPGIASELDSSGHSAQGTVFVSVTVDVPGSAGLEGTEEGGSDSGGGFDTTGGSSGALVPFAEHPTFRLPTIGKVWPNGSPAVSMASPSLAPLQVECSPLLPTLLEEGVEGLELGVSELTVCVRVVVIVRVRVVVLLVQEDGELVGIAGGFDGSTSAEEEGGGFDADRAGGSEEDGGFTAGGAEVLGGGTELLRGGLTSGGLLPKGVELLVVVSRAEEDGGSGCEEGGAADSEDGSLGGSDELGGTDGRVSVSQDVVPDVGTGGCGDGTTGAVGRVGTTVSELDGNEVPGIWLLSLHTVQFPSADGSTMDGYPSLSPETVTGAVLAALPALEHGSVTVIVLVTVRLGLQELRDPEAEPARAVMLPEGGGPVELRFNEGAPDTARAESSKIAVVTGASHLPAAVEGLVLARIPACVVETGWFDER